MIDQILQLLKQDDYYGQSELIDIAKGKYEFTTSLKRKREQLKRKEAWQLKGK